MKYVYLIALVLFFSSCRKFENVPGNDNTSQLWLNVDDMVSDFNITFVSQDSKGAEYENIIIYSNKVINPSIKTGEVLNKDIKEKWTLVHSDFDRTDEIIITSDDKTYSITGFGFQEKRLLYIKQNLNGIINIIDADILILESVIYVE